jgi:hypothetical protein
VSGVLLHSLKGSPKTFMDSFISQPFSHYTTAKFSLLSSNCQAVTNGYQTNVYSWIIQEL